MNIKMQESRGYQQSERCGPRNINHFVVFSCSDQNYRASSLWPVRISREDTNEKDLVATHRDDTAFWTLAKFALLSVGDTYSVPSGQPANGEVAALFSNW